MLQTKNNIRIFVVLLALTVLLPVSAQRSHYLRLKGDQLCEFGYYTKALSLFDKYESRNKADSILDELYLHTNADAHYKLGDFDDALDSYLRVLDADSAHVDYPFLKSLILRSSKPLEYSHLLATIDSVELEVYANFSFLDTVRRFDVDPFYALNSPNSELSAVDFKDRIYFSAIRDKRFSRKNVNTKLSNYNIFSVNHTKAHNVMDFGGRDYAMLTRHEKGIVDTFRNHLDIRYEEDINTGFHNGPIAFYNDTVAFVTVNERQNKGEFGEFNLTLDCITFSGDSVKVFNKSSRHYFGDYFFPNNVGQITFSKDRTKACMTVKLKDSSTQSDLWFAEQDSDGQWEPPYLASDVFNTDFNDLFPFWSEDDYLYFSTDGRKGSGGLDVFRVDLLDPEAKAVSVGLGVNSPYDDFAFSLDNNGKGYLTSNRAGGRGDDDIYTVEAKKGHVKVMLKSNPKWVDDPLFDLDECRSQLTVDSFDIIKDTSYVTLALPYGEYDLMHDLTEDSLYAHVSLYDDTAYVIVKYDKIPPDTLAIRFTNFGFNSDGMDEINNEKYDRVIMLLKDLPEIGIKLTGNTDMFGPAKYNEGLGMRRAKVMEKWLRQGGVTNKISLYSNGERNLISRTDHRLNRRVDVELIWSKDTTRVTYLANDNPRIEREVAIEYDSPKDYDTPLEPGYYLLIYHANSYMQENKCAEKYGLGDKYGILLYSKKSNVFNYYIDKPFKTASDALQFMDDSKLNAEIIYLE